MQKTKGSSPSPEMLTRPLKVPPHWQKSMQMWPTTSSDGDANPRGPPTGPATSDNPHFPGRRYLEMQMLSTQPVSRQTVQQRQPTKRASLQLPHRNRITQQREHHYRSTWQADCLAERSSPGTLLTTAKLTLIMPMPS